MLGKGMRKTALPHYAVDGVSVRQLSPSIRVNSQILIKECGKMLHLNGAAHHT